MISIGRGTHQSCSGIRRRDFLRIGGVGLGSLGIGVKGLEAGERDHLPGDRSVILLMLVGGPSQLETWDPKPDAPAEVRGPFGSIATRVPGVRICEHLPRLASRSDQFALIRSLHHDSAPIHETGLQLLQTGRVCRLEDEEPHFGSVAAQLLGRRGSLPPFAILPGPIANTGVNVSHGQSEGWLAESCSPFLLNDDPASPRFDGARAFERAQRCLEALPGSSADLGDLGRLFRPATRSAFDLGSEPADVRRRYGENTFGQSCLLARRLVERGVRVVTVNMFESVFNKVTWDCHGSAPFSSLADYRRDLLPTLDCALSALLDDLRDRGLLESTLVVATGEFGRTPKLNATGGRDHWPGVWTALAAGGGVRGGQVIGASDDQATAPDVRPVRPQELLATIYHCLGLPAGTYMQRPSGEEQTLVEDASPIHELLG
ncbi:MAG: DUF1501 domain-containing protein [Isosphaeraceae bacterium]